MHSNLGNMLIFIELTCSLADICTCQKFVSAFRK